jgi:citrate/tricarballylate utilization protein
MQALHQLINEASALAQGDVPETPALQEVARVMQICNACRYCEGYCAVFPAMTRRLAFGAADVHYLANLCHQCGACLHACQYAPPHEFAVNVPRAMAQVRVQTYAHYAWPRALGRAYLRNGLVLALAVAAALALFCALIMAWPGSATPAQGGNFYSLLPHNRLVALFAPVLGWAVLALGIGVARFWRDHHPGDAPPPAVAEAAHDALALKYLGGGQGQGCNNEDDAFSLAKRRCHHLTFYGFALCFAATAVATLYHYVLGQSAPYALPSAPKLLGVVGGVMLALGTAGLWRLNLARHPLAGDAAQRPMDLGFIALLFGVATSGLALWAGNQSAALATLLALHLGLVMALLATMPYGKFAHGVYRCAALLKFNIEKRQPTRLKLGDD